MRMLYLANRQSVCQCGKVERIVQVHMGATLDLSVGNVQTCQESITDYFVQLFCSLGGLALGGAVALLGSLVSCWAGLVVSSP